jgi:hypothetical protein
LQIFYQKKRLVYFSNEIAITFDLYIWSHHYTHKDKGWGLLNHQKPTVVGGYFCWFVSFFVTFFTTCNFCKLLFTVEGGKVSCFNLFSDYLRGQGVPLFIYFNFFYYWRGGGWRLMFFFSLSFDMWKEEGKRVSFFLKISFSLLSG